MANQVMITTTANPYDYFTQFNEWLAYDRGQGYYSLELLGRVARVSDELPDEFNEELIEEAVDEIVRENLSGVHGKLVFDPERGGSKLYDGFGTLLRTFSSKQDRDREQTVEV